jgi:hypothetical protein
MCSREHRALGEQAQTDLKHAIRCIARLVFNALDKSRHFDRNLGNDSVSLTSGSRSGIASPMGLLSLGREE